MASKRNRKVLCFSTDPQASLSDIFDRDIFGKGLISVIPQLDVVEIDADRRVADYQEEVKQKIRSMYGLTDIPPEIEEYIDSTSAEPAMYESATYDAMADLVSTSGHDLSVFDMPRFGHGGRGAGRSIAMGTVRGGSRRTSTRAARRWRARSSRCSRCIRVSRAGWT